MTATSRREALKLSQRNDAKEGSNSTQMPSAVIIKEVGFGRWRSFSFRMLFAWVWCDRVVSQKSNIFFGMRRAGNRSSYGLPCEGSSGHITKEI